ncbi:hypothetical protein [Rivularia sp. UHCC 0363]|uniref:hypothetical protein n=1 Tax=Rivularia sp. UHCC 0363 TaxID=3110244 RepID=UPI002B2202F9|nr:hypothetical protein [Rivularia sp. UHCC 0363]MEA5594794.1 hypothetical protein [Rivularia sp. UHCC 0363]
MLFYNRFTGQTTKQLPEKIILGQWQVITDSERVFLNTCELKIHSREYIFPDLSNRCSIRSDDGKTVEIKFSKWQYPSDILFESLQFFDSELQQLISNSASWNDLVKLPPLVPEIQEKINIQSLEITTKKHLGHIEEVCRRPRSYLKMETERLPVSRAQRISPHAAEFLSSHTEDWERRTFCSVVPKRILCMIKEELLDIYENKVTVKLVDNLLIYIRQRIQQVKALQQQFEDAEYLSGTTSDIHWRNKQRIYTLWGNYCDGATELKKAQATLQKLLQLRYKLQGLMGSDLYKAIPQRTVVANTLKRTNILVNDQHYRYVDLLWREWSRINSGQIKNSRQVFEENQKLLHGFESFCLLLIGLALTGDGNNKGFGFEAVDNQIPTRNNKDILFQGALGNIYLTWLEDGSFLLKSDAIKYLRLVPILANLTATDNSETILSIIETFSNSLKNITQYQTIILYPGTEEERKKLPLQIQRKINTLGNDKLPQEIAMSILPVSPLDIISLERLARAIHWWLNGQRYQSYPPTIAINIPDNLLQNTDWINKESKSNQIRVLRSPSLEEEQLFNTNINNLINQLKSRASKQKGEVQKLEKIKHLPSQAGECIKPLQICPVCRNLKDSFTVLNSQCFSCGCSKCDITWGTRSCGSCAKKYAYILTTKVEGDNRQPGWVERTFGRDVLSVPCWMKDNHNAFICPHCGVCSQSASSEGKNCDRCQ